jgi:hypothetical protein
MDAIKYETHAATQAGLNVRWRNQIWQDKTLDTKNKSESWWRSLAEANKEFIMTSAELAEKLGVKEISVGEMYNTLSQPFWSEDAPDFMMSEWVQTIKAARKVYSGKMYFDLSSTGGVADKNVIKWQYKAVKPVIDETDTISLSIWKGMSDNCNPTLEELEKNIGEFLDEEVLPIHEEQGKPVVITGIAFAAADCGSMGNDAYEVNSREVTPWKPDDGTPLDMNEQAFVYDAFMRAIADRPWITGSFTFGYWRHDTQDKQVGVRGKKAQLVLREWYAKI